MEKFTIICISWYTVHSCVSSIILKLIDFRVLDSKQLYVHVWWLLAEGVVELWLTSEDLGAYGHDIGVTLPELLWQLVDVIPEGAMMRLGMTNPPYILEHLEVSVPAFPAVLLHTANICTQWLLIFFIGLDWYILIIESWMSETATCFLNFRLSCAALMYSGKESRVQSLMLSVPVTHLVVVCSRHITKILRLSLFVCQAEDL